MAAGKTGKTSSAAGKRQAAKPETAPRKGTLTALQGDAVKASSAAEKRAELLIGLIARRKARIAEDFYDIGVALQELQKKKLYLVLGHASFAEMLRARDILGLSQAKKLIEIVSSLPRDKALQIGPEKAYALARYTAATPEPDLPAQLIEEGASIAGKRIVDLSVRELTAATRKVRSKAAAPKRRDPAEQQANAAARTAQAALRKRGAKGATALSRRAQGGWWLRIEIPVEAVAALLGE